MNNYPNQSQMENNIMAGTNGLGVQRIPSQAIPKQCKTPTRYGDSKTNTVAGGKKDIEAKMKKIMKHIGIEKV